MGKFSFEFGSKGTEGLKAERDEITSGKETDSQKIEEFDVDQIMDEAAEEIGEWEEEFDVDRIMDEAAEELENSKTSFSDELSKLMNDDEMIDPADLIIGQLVSVKYQGVNYDSILTGYERNSTTKLIFGTIRIELSKIIKGGN
jgi:phage protein D